MSSLAKTTSGQTTKFGLYQFLNKEMFFALLVFV